MATRNVRAATSATTLELASDLPQALDLNDTPCWLCLATADDLSDRAKDTIYRLFDDNMSSVSAETSMQYMEFMKRIELFDPLTRYILALKSQPPSRPKSASGGKKKGNSQTAKSDRSGWLDLDPGDVLGYCSFRFDTEETLGLKDAEVIYCYELQISSEARRKGLARILMRRLEQIGAERKMQKAMLTCLKANTSALEFYDREGYKADEIDPTRMAEEESDSDSGGEDDAGGNVGSDGESDEVVDYVILSKALP